MSPEPHTEISLAATRQRLPRLVPQGNVVVGYDFSETADLGLEYALDLTSDPAVSVHVLWTDSSLAKLALTDPHLLEETHRRAADLERRLEIVSDKRRKAGLSGADGSVTIHVGRGNNPVTDIVKLAQETRAQVIILGANHRTNVARLMFGSLSLEVVNAAPCPVLLMKALSYESA